MHRPGCWRARASLAEPCRDVPPQGGSSGFNAYLLHPPHQALIACLKPHFEWADLAHYPLVIKPHPLQLPKFEIGLYWHDRYHRDPANKWLRDFVVQQFETSDAT